MTASQHFCLNQPAVISEVIDGEAIIVNLDSGAYYSLRDSGCAIWELLLQQMTTPDVVQALTARYADESTTMQVGVETLLAELLNEQLLVPAHGAAPLAPPPTQGSNGHRPSFPPPVLEKFTDMADLLLLDPIHEVEEMGWPHAAVARAPEHA